MDAIDRNKAFAGLMFTYIVCGALAHVNRYARWDFQVCTLSPQECQQGPCMELLALVHPGAPYLSFGG